MLQWRMKPNLERFHNSNPTALNQWYRKRPLFAIHSQGNLVKRVGGPRDWVATVTASEIVGVKGTWQRFVNRIRLRNCNHARHFFLQSGDVQQQQFGAMLLHRFVPADVERLPTAEHLLEIKNHPALLTCHLPLPPPLHYPLHGRSYGFLRKCCCSEDDRLLIAHEVDRLRLGFLFTEEMQKPGSCPTDRRVPRERKLRHQLTATGGWMGREDDLPRGVAAYLRLHHRVTWPMILALFHNVLTLPAGESGYDMVRHSFLVLHDVCTLCAYSRDSYPVDDGGFVLFLGKFLHAALCASHVRAMWHVWLVQSLWIRLQPHVPAASCPVAVHDVFSRALHVLGTANFDLGMGLCQQVREMVSLLSGPARPRCLSPVELIVFLCTAADRRAVCAMTRRNASKWLSPVLSELLLPCGCGYVLKVIWSRGAHPFYLTIQQADDRGLVCFLLDGIRSHDQLAARLYPILLRDLRRRCSFFHHLFFGWFFPLRVADELCFRKEHFTS